MNNLDAYIVGGAVRDSLLGLPVGDRDWVVVGSSPEAMVKLGFIPVGGDFPVFLHPKTKEEYALARTERKSGKGYKGFVFFAGPNVSLEDDLRRRDLTINAIAKGHDGQLIDPLNGVADIQTKVLRHVGQAFAEDPVRLLRLARFAARFSDFSIAPETILLAKELVSSGEVDALVPERVWQEVAKGLMTSNPGRMFTVLQETGALERIAPGLIFKPELVRELAYAAEQGLPLESRFALLCRLSANAATIANSMRAPAYCRDSAVHLQTVLTTINEIALHGLNANSVLNTMLACDAMRKPERFMDLIHAAGCALKVNVNFWQSALEAIKSVDAGAIAKAAGSDTTAIKAAIYAARLRVLQPVGSVARTESN